MPYENSLCLYILGWFLFCKNFENFEILMTVPNVWFNMIRKQYTENFISFTSYLEVATIT